MPDSTGGFERIGPVSSDTGGFERIAPPQTTVGGIAAAAGRGLAPVAAGAGIGAALGAPFAGVGAVPGAIAGAGAAGLAELGIPGYNFLARHTGLPEAPTPSDVTGKLLDVFGVKRPSTTAERLTEDVAGMVGGAALGAMPTKELSQAIAKSDASAAEKSIQSLYNRAVKPSIEGKGTASAVESYNQSARSAIDSIVQNKANLVFDGVKGQLPKSLAEFGEAVEQSKGAIYRKYDALARQAGDKGASVDFAPVVKELRDLADSRTIKDFQPEIGNFAQALAERLADRGSYSVGEAQAVLQNLNQRLQTFYKNPTPSEISRSQVDAMVANQLRQQLDSVITQASGTGYAQLKQQYGALKSIEDHVVKAAQREARKDPQGGVFGSLFDVATAADVIHGVTTLNPAAIASGVGLRAAKSYYAKLRSPNRAVQKIFEIADRQNQIPSP